MHQADVAATCHMGRTALCPHQLIASRWWTKSESPSGPTLSGPLKKKDTDVWPSSWIGVLSVIGRARRHLHLGLPAEHRHRYTHPARSKRILKQHRSRTHRQRTTDPKQASTLRHGRLEHEQTEPEHRQPPSEGAESDATCGKPRARTIQKGWRQRHRLANPTLRSSCCHLDMPRWNAHQHGGCRSMGMGLGQICQVHLSSRIADSHAADGQWVHNATPNGQSNCLQGWCIINVFQQPVVHPIPLRGGEAAQR